MGSGPASPRRGPVCGCSRSALRHQCHDAAVRMSVHIDLFPRLRCHGIHHRCNVLVLPFQAVLRSVAAGASASTIDCMNRDMLLQPPWARSSRWCARTSRHWRVVGEVPAQVSLPARPHWTGPHEPGAARTPRAWARVHGRPTSRRPGAAPCGSRRTARPRRARASSSGRTHFTFRQIRQNPQVPNHFAAALAQRRQHPAQAARAPARSTSALVVEGWTTRRREKKSSIPGGIIRARSRIR
jgi:hypothetical protein